MNTKILAVALAALLVAAGGAAAVGSTVASDADQPDTRDADIEATYEDGNVTVTVTNGDDPVPNATVEVGDGEYTTDANGSVTAPVEDDDEIDVEVEAPGFEGEHEYALVDGELVLQEEKFEYDVGAEDGADEEDDEEADADDAETESEDEADEDAQEEDDDADDEDEEDTVEDEADADQDDADDEDEDS